MTLINLTKVFKVFSITLLAFITFNCNQNKDDSTLEGTLEIRFEDHFLNDKLNFHINNKPILKQVELTSQESYGLTDVWVKISFKKNHMILSSSKFKEKKEITLKGSTLLFETELNKKKFENEIDLSLGRIIGISKLKDGSIILTQSKEKILYD